MIGWLNGKIVERPQPGKLVVNVNGVGYDVETSLQTFFQLDAHPDMISLHIHTIVREDALLLYGFLDQQERTLFRALIKVNGVGPKVAISILSSATPSEFIDAILQQNTSFLVKLPGIGKKTAERLIIEMKDSVSQLFHHECATPVQQKNPSIREQHEAISALEALGFKSQEVIKVVKKIDDGNKTCEQLIRHALQLLA